MKRKESQREGWEILKKRVGGRRRKNDSAKEGVNGDGGGPD